jgi:LPXTG-motif cell wall-anchored protein
MNQRQHYTYELASVEGGNYYLKIEVTSQGNTWNGEISKVRIDYSDNPPTTDVLSDDLGDFSKMDSYSNIVLVNYEPWRYDNDANRVVLASKGNSGSVVYKTPYKIDSFIVDTYRLDYSGTSSPATFKFYVSSDNVNYTEVDAVETNIPKVVVEHSDPNEVVQMAERKHYQYTLANIKGSNTYFKIEVTPNGNEWNGELSNVQIGYSNNPPVAGTLVDEMNDSSKMHFITKGLEGVDGQEVSGGFESWDPSQRNGDPRRLRNALGAGAGEGANIVYVLPQRIDSFKIDFYRADYGGDSAPSKLKFYVSQDNINYTNVTPVETVVGLAGGTDIKHVTYKMDNIPGTPNYLKIEFTDVKNNWNGEIGKVQINYTNEIPKKPLVPSLAEAYKDIFPIGVAVGGRDLTERGELLKKQFNVLTTENCMKPNNIHPAEDVWDWTETDQIVDFAQQNNMIVRNHVLIYFTNMPDWFFKNTDGTEASQDLVWSRVKTHIETIMKRYKGKIHSYEVTNECIDNNGNIRDTKLKQVLGDDYIPKLFRIARDAANAIDSSITLGYNDYNYSREASLNGIYNLVADLKSKGLIDWVGIQSHLNLPSLDIAYQAKLVQKMASLGVKVVITELDMSLYEGGDPADTYKDGPTPEILEEQAQYYGALFDMYRAHKDVIDSVIFWNVNDATSWLNYWALMKQRNDYPLLFDSLDQPKPAFYRVLDFEKKLARPMPRIPETPVILQSEAIYGTPAIDGEIDAVWNKANIIVTDKFMGAAGAYANIKTMWDERNLYALYEVHDATLSNLSENLNEPYKQDSIELFIDELNSKQSQYGQFDQQYRVNYENLLTGGSSTSFENVVSATKLTSTGYIVEISVPFRGIKPVNGQIIGFDSQVNDDAGSGARDHIAKWCDPTNNSWQSAERWGELKLVDKPQTTVPVDKVALTTAIKDATTLIESKIVGTAVGNVPKSAKDVFQKVIDGAKAVNNNTSATQAEVDAQVALLGTAATNFNKAIITTLEVVTTDNITDTVNAIKNAPVGSNVVVIVTNQLVDKAIFDAIKGIDKTVTFKQDGLEWIFNGKDMIYETKTIDMAVNVSSLSSSTTPNKAAITEKVKNEDVMIISFANNGQLPGKATIKLKLDDQWLVGKDTSNIFVYYYNKDTNMIEEIASGKNVDNDGYVQFDITHNSDYIISDKAISAATIVPLPQTGSAVDTFTLLISGIFIMVAGILFLSYRKKENN